MSKPKGAQRIALFYSFLGGGGIERSFLNLSQALLEHGHQVDLVLGTASGPHLGRVPRGVRIIDLGTPRQLGRLPKLVRYLRQARPAALLAAGHYTNELAICAKYLARVSTRIIVSEQNTLSQTARLRHWSKKRLTLLAAGWLYPWADSIVAVSQGVAQDLATLIGLSVEHIRVIYNPVVTPQLTEQAQEPVEHPWFKPGELPVILGVGKLEPQKDFPTLFRAFAKVLQTQRTRLMILGWGPDRDQLEALVRDLALENDVSFHGYVTNPYAYMSKAAVLVLSSAWEGLPTVLIEAMALGTPVVSTDCPSGPAEILHHGCYGPLTPVHDSEALAQAIIRVLAGETKTVDAEWLEQFHVQTATQHYLDVMGLADAVSNPTS
jgi:glycosyltransferase involved in cell wall biosynthesis